MLYPFECDACGHTEDIYASMADGPPQLSGETCPACKEGKVWRVYTTGLTFVKGQHKNSKTPEEIYAQDERTSLPRFARGMTPEQYEKAHSETFKAEEKVAAEVDKNRRLAGRSDSDFRHVGSVPLAEFAARKAQAGSTTAAQDREWMESRGHIFEHEKGRGA